MLDDQYKTRVGCHVANSCEAPDTSCPKKSNCIRDWDRHICQCFPGTLLLFFCKHLDNNCIAGFVGDKCEDVCQLSNVCENGGTCVHAYSDRAGYRCLCAAGFTGQRCETALPYDPIACPAGWFGAHGRCGPCRCGSTDGFSGDCHRDTGECICKVAFL